MNIKTGSKEMLLIFDNNSIKHRIAPVLFSVL